jgi:RNA polymerase sigma-70 factor (ECF subfamily)
MGPVTEPSDQQLVDDARRGSTEAFSVLVRRHQRKAFAVALGVLHDPEDAKDVCQEAFLRVHKGLDRFEGDAQFFTWLYRIIVNLAIDQLRKKRGEKFEFDEKIESDSPDPSGIAPQRLGFDPARALGDKELRGKIRGALDQLSAVHRTVLVLREVEGLSYKEIADAMECSIGTVMSRLFHARKKMQSLLGEYAVSDENQRKEAP